MPGGTQGPKRQHGGLSGHAAAVKLYGFPELLGSRDSRTVRDGGGREPEGFTHPGHGQCGSGLPD